MEVGIREAWDSICNISSPSSCDCGVGIQALLAVVVVLCTLIYHKPNLCNAVGKSTNTDLCYCDQWWKRGGVWKQPYLGWGTVSQA